MLALLRWLWLRSCWRWDQFPPVVLYVKFRRCVDLPPVAPNRIVALSPAADPHLVHLQVVGLTPLEEFFRERLG